MHRRRVAVVGSGAGGLGALYALSKSDYEVHLLEAEASFGGHCHTYRHDEDINIDLGFIAMNKHTYSTLYNAMIDLGVAFNQPPNSLSVARDHHEWSTSSIFARRLNLVSPSFWRMLWDIMRFKQIALQYLSSELPDSRETFDKFIQRHRFSNAFRDDYLVPMTSLLWTADSKTIREEFPIHFLLRYLWKHNLLITLRKGYQWLSIKGGSSEYVNAVLARFPPEQLHSRSRVTSMNPQSDGSIQLAVEDGAPGARLQCFDYVIFACHAPQALAILGANATAQEQALLGAFRTTQQTVTCHMDSSILPSRRAWSSWNYRSRGDRSTSSCLINIEMDVPFEKGLFITSGELCKPVDPSKVLYTWSASHPVYTTSVIERQKHLHEIQNVRNIAFCGAWTGNGLHEDGFLSGVKIAVDYLDGSVPFDLGDTTPPIRLHVFDHICRGFIWCIETVVSTVGMPLHRTAGHGMGI